MNTTCEDVSDLLPELAAASLDDGQAAAVRAHVAGCAQCTEELWVVQSVQAARIAAPAGLAGDISTAISVRMMGTSVGAPGVAAGRRRHAPHYAVAAAAAVALLGGVLAVHQLRENPPQLTRADTLTAPATGESGVSYPVTIDPLVGGQSAVSELTEAQLEALLTEMDS